MTCDGANFRPGVLKESPDKNKVQTGTLSITATPRTSSYVKAKAGDDSYRDCRCK